MVAIRHFRRLQICRPLIYEDAHVWLVLFAGLEALLTWALYKRDGLYLGPWGQIVLGSAGLWAVALFDLGLAVILALLCEEIGRRRLVTGRTVARLMAGVWGAAVLVLLMQFCMTY